MIRVPHFSKQEIAEVRKNGDTNNLIEMGK